MRNSGGGESHIKGKYIRKIIAQEALYEKQNTLASKKSKFVYS